LALLYETQLATFLRLNSYPTEIEDCQRSLQSRPPGRLCTCSTRKSRADLCI